MRYFDAPSHPEIQRPAGNLLIFSSVFCALLLNGLPMEGWWLTLRPDFVAVVLLYWCTHNPERIGVGLAWSIGVLADVADASLFGQHALAYTLLAFGGVTLHHRLQMFSLRQQALQIFFILALSYAVYALLHWLVDGYMKWEFLLGCLTSTVMWLPLSLLFRSIRQLRMDRERP